MSNKYRKQKLPTEVDVSGKDYIFVTCGGDSLHNALGVFKDFKGAKDCLNQYLKRKKIASCVRYSISVLPIESRLDREQYFSIFYDDNGFPDGTYNEKIESAVTEIFG